MREYRKVDDTVTMRLNRTLAQFRDRDRKLEGSSRSNPEEEACRYFWDDLVCMCFPSVLFLLQVGAVRFVESAYLCLSELEKENRDRPVLCRRRE